MPSYIGTSLVGALRALLSVPGTFRPTLHDWMRSFATSTSSMQMRNVANRNHFRYADPTWLHKLDSFKCLREEESEILIVILRGAWAAFPTELADRREPSRDETLEEYKKRESIKCTYICLSRTKGGHWARVICPSM